MKDYVNGWFYPKYQLAGPYLVCGPVSAIELLNLFKKKRYTAKHRCDAT